MAPTRVLVLGSSGRIGTMLRRCWATDTSASQGDAIEFVFQTRQAQPDRPDDLLWDITEDPPDALRLGGAYDCLIVLSGIVPKPDADFTLNTAIATASLRAAARLGIASVFLASTSAVYGSYQDEPFREDHIPRPVTDYGRSKYSMETTARAQARALGVKLCCLRIGNVSGADALLLTGAALAAGETILLDRFHDGGTPVRSYMGPRTFARILRSLIHNRADVPEVLNIAAPKPVSMLALAEAAQMPVTLRPVDAQDHQYVTLDCQALAALHAFEPLASDPSEIVRQWQDLRGA